MKRVIVPLFMALAFVSSVFAQDEAAAETTDQGAAAQPPAVEEPKQEDKKSAFHIDKRPDPVWGIRLGAHLAGISGQTISFGWHLGGSFYPVKVFDASLGGDIVGLKMFVEPNVYFTTKSGWEGTNQYWLDVPVMANFMFTVFSFRFKYCIGPYVGVGMFGDFDKVVTAADIAAGNQGGRDVGRFDVGLYNTFGYEWAKNIWSDVTVGTGFIDMVDKESGSKNFIVKFTAGLDF